MSVQTLFKKLRSWLTMTRVLLYSVKKFSSHSTDSRSRWLVGSSRSKSWGSKYKPFARATRCRQPPLRRFVGTCSISLVIASSKDPHSARLRSAGLQQVQCLHALLKSWISVGVSQQPLLLLFGLYKFIIARHDWQEGGRVGTIDFLRHVDHPQIIWHPVNFALRHCSQ